MRDFVRSSWKEIVILFIALLMIVLGLINAFHAHTNTHRIDKLEQQNTER